MPLPASVGESIRAHMHRSAPVEVTLPWEDPANGDLVTVPLIFMTTHSTVVKQHVLASTAWHPALRAAGAEVARANGLHALRHFYASALLDAGESIKAVSEWLGHANAAFTLRVYAHLVPESPGRAQKALDALLPIPPASDGPMTAQHRS